ncbi:MAG: AAA family ATPase [Magnetococcus sp. YQC-5]
MLTRLKVTGFKNLVDVDVRFGPFTCIAGANGAGKSNLFDAIQFLSALASKTLNEAALSIRDQSCRIQHKKKRFVVWWIVLSCGVFGCRHTKDWKLLQTKLYLDCGCWLLRKC